MPARDFFTYEERLLPVSTLRDNLSAIVRSMPYEGPRVVVTFHGRPIAGLCRVEDLNMIREWYRKSTREKELEMEMAMVAWRRAQAEGRS
jgi:antitoxin (DNA-binding transcriptional repressor) of toxin-antitoxin stability system